MALAMRVASSLCAQISVPVTREILRRGSSVRYGAAWRARATFSRRQCMCSLQVDFREEVEAVETLAIDLAKKAGAMIRDKSGHALQLKCNVHCRQDGLLISNKSKIFDFVDASGCGGQFVNTVHVEGCRLTQHEWHYKVDTKESRFDLVTEVDKACEDFLRSQVQEKFPRHFYLGEETATEKELDRLKYGLKDSDWTWIVDPIDGTLNFVAGIPLSVVSIGVALGENMEVGVVYNPFHDELFVAKRGQGAYFNGIPIRVLPPDTELEDTTVSVGFPSKPESRLRMLEAIQKVAPTARSIRALGTAALHMSYVGAGRLGCFFEHNLKPWDVAAARLIVQEAGGRVTDMNGNDLPLMAGSVLATNGGILHDRLVELIAE